MIANPEQKAQEVFDYLAENPDFLLLHPHLLSHLTIAHDVEGGVSLVERQVKVLREKNRELQGRLIEMLSAAQLNEQLLTKCIRLVLCLIDCRTLEQWVNTLHDGLLREFDLAAVSIHLFGHWQRVEHARVHSTGQTLQQKLDCRFPDNEPVCGRMDLNIKQSLFAHHHLERGSVALLPLGKQGQYGIIALLSENESHFSPEMGSLFLELISSVATQVLMKYKDFK